VQYRPEIDGLRAFAVLSVIFYHAGLTVFQGGYVGVDVFFVVSGYLITTIICEAKSEGRFSLVDFYERRARRIFPALFAIVLFSLVGSWFLMLPYQFGDLLRATLGVAVFSSNIVFWRRSGYFDNTAETNPLLHTWSLAVEEQFYIFFPLLIMLAWRLGPKRLAVLFLIALLSSLALTEWGWRYQPGANFFLLPTRAWELLVGALLSLHLAKCSRKPRHRSSAQLTPMLGLGLIATAVVFFDETTPFPSYWTLVPVVGTSLIVLSHSGSYAARFLSLRPLVGVGLISYSAYLWHQPMLSFLRLGFVSEPSTPITCTVAFFSLLVSWASWRFIEQPFRDKSKYSRNHIFAMTGIGTAVLVGTAILGLTTSTFDRTYSPHLRSLVEETNVQRSEYVVSRFNELTKWDKEEGPQVLIIGDSFAQDFVNLADVVGAFSDHSVKTIYIPAKCQPVMTGQAVHVAAKDRPMCERYNLHALKKTIATADTIFLVASWRQWSAKALPDTLARLQLSSDQKVFVIGRKRFGRYQLSGMLQMPKEELLALRGKPEKTHLRTNHLMKESLSPSVFIDMHSMLCSDDDTCALFTPPLCQRSCRLQSLS